MLTVLVWEREWDWLLAGLQSKVAFFRVDTNARYTGRVRFNINIKCRERVLPPLGRECVTSTQSLMLRARSL